MESHAQHGRGYHQIATYIVRASTWPFVNPHLFKVETLQYHLNYILPKYGDTSHLLPSKNEVVKDYFHRERDKDYKGCADV